MITLITRPEIDAQSTSRFLEKHSIATLIDPMVVIAFEKHPLINISEFEHIIFTSKNGVRAFCQYTHHRDLVAWCVGDETQKLAQENGFKTTYSAQGSSQDLQKLIQKEFKPQKILRICRVDQPDTLSNKLNSRGYTVLSLPLYKAIPKTNISSATIAALTENKITDFIFYSPQTARITIENIQKANLTDACRTGTAWCISKKTADALGSLLFKEIVIAPMPNEKDLLTPLIARNTVYG